MAAGATSRPAGLRLAAAVRSEVRVAWAGVMACRASRCAGTRSAIAAEGTLSTRPSSAAPRRRMPRGRRGRGGGGEKKAKQCHGVLYSVDSHVNIRENVCATSVRPKPKPKPFCLTEFCSNLCLESPVSR
eukprot:scaffold116949_cov32-Tisochrysis_lutea.AAC.1